MPFCLAEIDSWILETVVYAGLGTENGFGIVPLFRDFEVLIWCISIWYIDCCCWLNGHEIGLVLINDVMDTCWWIFFHFRFCEVVSWTQIGSSKQEAQEVFAVNWTLWLHGHEIGFVLINDVKDTCWWRLLIYEKIFMNTDWKMILWILFQIIPSFRWFCL